MRAPVRRVEPRSAESWDVAVARAREAWDSLTGGPPTDGRYGDLAATAILDVALRLWAETVRAMD